VKAIQPLKYLVMFQWLFLLLFILSGSGLADDQTNLLANPDLVEGSSAAPDDWTRRPRIVAEAFARSRDKEAPPEFQIMDSKSQFAKLRTRPYWQREVALDPGWYLLSADIRTENDSNGSGAVFMFCDVGHSNLVAGSSLEAIPGAPLCGATPAGQSRIWKPLRAYLKVDRFRRVFEIRLGLEPGSGSAKAFFRHPVLIRTAEPIDANIQQIDLEELGLWRNGHQVLLDHFGLVGEIFNVRSGAVLFCLLLLLTLLEHWTTRTDDPEIDAGSEHSKDIGSHRSSGDVRKWPAYRPATLALSWSADLGASLTIAVCFVFILLLILLFGRIQWVAGLGLLHVRPGVVGGDEPHYVMVMNSLLFDHDLAMQDDYDRVARGGLDAGERFSRVELDHHTVVINRRTGHHSLGMNNGTNWQRNPAPEFAPSKDVYEVPAHPVTFPALLALAILPFRPAISNVEEDAGLVVAIISWLTTLATYFLARRIGMPRGAAILSALLLLLASPWLAYSRSYFREPTIGLFMILAMWAAIANRPVGCALGAIGAAALKPAYVFVGACFAAEDLRERKLVDTFKIAVLLGSAMLVLLITSLWLRRSVVRAGLRMVFSLRHRFDSLLDPRQGLLVYAPWTLFGFVASFRSFFSPLTVDRALRRMAAPFAINLVVSSAFGPGFCYGPRYWVPFLPWLAIATVQGMRKAGLMTRVVTSILVLTSVAIAVPGALCYPELFQKTPLQAWRMFLSSPLPASVALLPR